MSLMNKFKEVFSSGCIKEESKKHIETIQEALELIAKLKSGKCSQSFGQISVNRLLDQVVHWIDIIQQDMNIIKAHKIREINADLTGIKNQLGIMADEMLKIKKDISSKQPKKTVKIIKQEDNQ